MELCFATNNVNKLEEVQSVVPPVIKILSLGDIGCNEELPETQDTIEGNSLQKALYVFQNYQVNCFADDTGLEVDILGGRPGVYSSRYAGLPSNSENNISKLLEELTLKLNRRARFRTVITLLWEQSQKQFEGILEGSIIDEKRGSNGFGYDPIFMPEGLDLTLAEMDSHNKNAISHRAIATRKLIAFLNENFTS